MSTETQILILLHYIKCINSFGFDRKYAFFAIEAINPLENFVMT